MLHCCVQEISIARVGSKVHEGLCFRYRSAAAGGGEPVGERGWHTSLGRLSGGERTLVSLALILAVCTASSSPSACALQCAMLGPGCMQSLAALSCPSR